MSHYFIEDESLKRNLKKIVYYYTDKKFVFTTHDGLFSKDHVDEATDILLKSIPPLSGSLLDMGCGYGCIGIVLAKMYNLKLTQCDVNKMALDMTRVNCRDNNVESEIIKSDCFENITGLFDTIVINPPIHAGKSVTYRMFEDSINHLNIGGCLYVVNLKKHGAESTMAKLTEVFGSCEVIYKKKGIFVFRCIKK